jgi:hypothetical protein
MRSGGVVGCTFPRMPNYLAAASYFVFAGYYLDLSLTEAAIDCDEGRC